MSSNVDEMVLEALAGLDEYSQPGAVELALSRLVDITRRLSPVPRGLVKKRAKERLRRLKFADADTVDAAFGRDGSAHAEVAKNLDGMDWPQYRPAGHPADLDALLTKLSLMFSSHVVLPSGAADALALWVAHAYVFDHFPITPYLGVSSATKGCGKSTLLEVIEAFVPRPLNSSHATPAVIFRSITLAQPTLLLDEGDSYLAFNEDLRGILNSGHRKSSARVFRCVGDDHTPKAFSTWCAKVVALIGALPSTLEDRSIIIRLSKKLVTQRVEPISQHDLQLAAASVCSGLLRWAQDRGPELDQRPLMPGELQNRVADNWRPLMSIADDAGGRWPQRARDVAMMLMPREDEDIPVMLLSDLRDVFHEKGATLFSDEIVGTLLSLEHRPWTEIDRGRPMTHTTLAKLLKPFGVGPMKVRRGPTPCKGIELSGSPTSSPPTAQSQNSRNRRNRLKKQSSTTTTKPTHQT